MNIKERLRRLSDRWGDMSVAPEALAEIERLEAENALKQKQFEEYMERSADDVVAIRAERDALKTANEWMEAALLPHGYSNNSIAVQTLTVALSQLWKMLGVNDQTAAVGKMLAIQASNERMEAALREAHKTLAKAFDRIHCLPRTTDTELAALIGSTRAGIEAALSTHPVETDEQKLKRYKRAIWNAHGWHCRLMNEPARAGSHLAQDQEIVDRLARAIAESDKKGF